MRESNWFGIDVCIKCENELTDQQKHYRNGICARCGHITRGTVCDTEKVVTKIISHSPWWKFWGQKQKEQFCLISQMNRCSVSIPSNIAEGCSRNSDIELKRFIEIAIGSSFELETQLLLAKEIYQKEDVSLFDELNRLQKMMNAYHLKLKATPNTNYQKPITNN